MEAFENKTWEEWKRAASDFFKATTELDLTPDQVVNCGKALRLMWINRGDWTAAEEWQSEMLLGMITRRELESIQTIKARKKTDEIMDGIDPSWGD